MKKMRCAHAIECGSATERQNLGVCNSMGGPRGYCAERSQPDRERQTPQDFTYMWNLKNKINTHTKQKQTHTYREQIDGCQMGEGLGDE